MDNNIEDDDGLYDLINLDHGFDNGSETCRTDDLMFNTSHIDWNQIKVDGNVSNITENLNALKLMSNNVCVDNSELLSVRSKLINERAEANLNIYLPHNLRRNIFNGSAKVDYCLCRECGGRNTPGLGWCLFCGVLLIGRNRNDCGGVESTDNVCNVAVKWRHIEVEEITKEERGRVKLDLRGLETVRCNGSIDWDFDLNEEGESAMIGVPCHTVVPPLDLSVLDSSRIVDESKENLGKAAPRRWATSSLAWADIPHAALQKKSSTYIRNKLNSCTNKMGISVFRSGKEDEREQTRPLGEKDERRTTEKITVVKPGCNGVRKLVGNDLGTFSSVEKSTIIIENNVVTEPSEWSVNKSSILIGCSWHNDTSVSQWQCLPAEIWIRVMKYLRHTDLSRLQQTCRRIYSIGLDSSLWHIVSLYRHSTLSDQHILCIARKNPKELHFKNCFGTNITNNGLEVMFKICGNGLRKISFISCSKGAFEDDLFLVKSAEFCPNVTHINASYLMNFQDDTLTKMIKGFKKIESLNIMGAHSISNQSIRSLTEHHRASLINLDLYGCFKLNSSTLPLLEKCLNLKSLALGSINNLRRSALIDMLKKLSQLIILDLRGTMNLVDDSLLQQICHSCPKLQQIILTNSSRLTDDGVIGLAKSCVSTSIKILDICGCSKITEKGLEQVLKHCHELEDLDISCTGIRGDWAKYFKMYSPSKLKCLRINNNKFISTDELLSLIRSCKKLDTVYMCGFTSIGAWPPIEQLFPHVTFKHE